MKEIQLTQGDYMKKTTKDELHLHPEMVKLTDRELAELALNEIGVA